MTKVRSPNYPMLSLDEAVARVRTVFEKENRHPADREVIAKDLGYSSLNGASLGVISALAKYGLLEQSGGDQFRVSPLALDILLNVPGDSDRVIAVEMAAFTPALFRELRDRYGETMPSDQNLRAYLVKKGFNPRTVDGVIRSYRDTVTFVGEEMPENAMVHPVGIASVGQVGSPTVTPSSAPRPQIVSATLEPSPLPHPEQREGELVLSFKIGEESQARIEFQGHVTQEAIQKLIKLLDVSLDTFPSKAAAVSATAVTAQPTLSPSSVAAESPGSLLTDEAKTLLDGLSNDSVPAFMTSNLKRVAEENGIPVAPDATPNEVIAALRERAMG